ncbi:arsenical-resistance protein, partial [Listeria monocytogenes]|uniref:arsenic resistance protein n=1 Tax=Listeria monocytogenes TaxID=1639 RepID=UPI003C6D0BDE
IEVPYGTVFLSVFIFVIIPFSATYLYRRHLVRSRGQEWADRTITKIVDTAGPYTICALLLTLVLIFIFQGEKIYNNPIDIV